MERPRILAPWLRRGLEAGIFGALLSFGTLLAFHFSRPEPRVTLPNGIDGALILTPAILALGVFSVSYPAFLGATREDAVLGAAAAFLIGADLLMLASLVIADSIFVGHTGRTLPLGMVSAVTAVPVAVIGLGIGQITTLGFGRSAAFRTAAAALAAGIIVTLAVAKFI